MKMTEIGRRIRSARNAAGYTIEQLAEITDISPSYMSMIERGNRMPSLDNFVALANALHVSADQLIGDALKYGYKGRASALSERFDAMAPTDRDKMLDIIEFILSKK